jgi:putative transposase
MDYEKLQEAFLQGTEREAAELFRQMMKGVVRVGLLEAMNEEVTALCGPRYRPDPGSDCRRAGSERGVAYVDGAKEVIARPRVRAKDEGEVRLSTYEAASSPQGVFEQVVAAVGQGLPVRGCERAFNGAVSKSGASRMWIEKSREQLALLRERRLDDADWLVLLMDGVWLTRELCVVIAVGIDLEGNKWVLDFEVGSSESAAVVTGLLERLEKRKFAPGGGRRLLVLRDGSAAIEKAVCQRWPEAVRQECQVHAQANVREKLRQRDRADVDRLFKALREAQGAEAGEEAFEEVLEFVSERNAAAAVALKERREGLLAFQRLNVPATLNTTFVSTNLIENVIRNWRAQSGNVKRWNEKEDMVSRWMASGLLWAEAGFRKVRHAGDLPQLAAALSPGLRPRPRLTPRPRPPHRATARDKRRLVRDP